jgi:hypothetical protein
VIAGLLVLAALSAPPYWQRIEAALLRPGLATMAGEVTRAAAAAEAVPARQAVGAWTAVAGLAERCTARARASVGADRSWAPPPGPTTLPYASLAELERACAAVLELATTAASDAATADRGRLVALTQAARLDRARILAERGQPLVPSCRDDAPACVLRAAEWSYVVGPTGPLDTYETTTFSFVGDRLRGQRQRITHEHP